MARRISRAKRQAKGKTVLALSRIKAQKRALTAQLKNMGKELSRVHEEREQLINQINGN